MSRLKRRCPTCGKIPKERTWREHGQYHRMLDEQKKALEKKLQNPQSETTVSNLTIQYAWNQDRSSHTLTLRADVRRIWYSPLLLSWRLERRHLLQLIANITKVKFGSSEPPIDVVPITRVEPMLELGETVWLDHQAVRITAKEPVMIGEEPGTEYLGFLYKLERVR